MGLRTHFVTNFRFQFEKLSFQVLSKIRKNTVSHGDLLTDLEIFQETEEKFYSTVTSGDLLTDLAFFLSYMFTIIKAIC